MLDMVQDDEGGDEFMAVKPWIGAIVEPTEPPPTDNSIPDDDLNLRWVHGYRAYDSRNNLRYTARGELVYPAAALGVVFSTKKWTQRSAQSPLPAPQLDATYFAWASSSLGLRFRPAPARFLCVLLPNFFLVPLA